MTTCSSCAGNNKDLDDFYVVKFLAALRRLAAVGLVALLLSLSTAAQEKKAFDWRFYESSATYWAGTGFAYHSSFGGQELNPTFRDKHGRVSGVRYLAVKGGVYALTIALQKKMPRKMNWLRRVVGYIDFGFAVNNYRVGE
jgi:hypothetical protein